MRTVVLKRAELLYWLAPLSLVAMPVWAQEVNSTGAGGSRLQMQLGASLLVSDQLARSEKQSAKDRGALLMVSPGVVWRSNRGAVQGAVDYSLNTIKKIKTDTDMRQIQHQLKASVRASLLPEHLSLDVNGNIGQQALSAFATQSVGSQPAAGANRSEVGSLSVTPQMRVRLAGVAQLQLRHTQSVQRVRGTLAGDVNGRITALTLSPVRDRVLNWSFDLSDQRSTPRLGRSTRTELALIGLNWRPDVDWRLGARAGQERSNLLEGLTRTADTYGGSANWQPSARTAVAFNWDRRLAADQYSLSANHRLPRSTLGLSYNRSVNLPGSYLLGEAQTRYDQLFALYASREPDAARRDLLVRQELARLGLGVDAPVSAGFLSSSSSLSHALQFNWAWALQRSVFTFGLSQRRTERLGSAPVATQDDLAISSMVKQQGINLAWTYRLAPTQSLTAQWVRQHNQGERASLDSTLDSANLMWTLQLGLQTQFSASYRHSRFEATQRPYDENALMLTLTQQF
ncbi:TIGR03016 family PEP-CTERM system-associated outer membrane protein [Inhella proteolytica]|uniref:TIGR03016 family PEP-CTERM system-associated outer membrane protein n=1 Tax=Inhella proteolytica TaxID=2795029 RepID=A0A931NGB7_9BURK|nr:TIGR03016 family PEP-CTERM system-associated outer membrane protein [Inhella proteolytica]MBH9576528.1 TIGR03016 family PEP-CTERM system-associated outer membrane protein [Inhella proteolytica]